jgi:hypothetical protein
MKTKIIKKFTDCDRAFYPYIEKVLRRLPKEVRGRMLNDKSFQIISFGHLGQYYDFEKPVKDLVILNDKILSQPEFEIIHTIAHEIAHWIRGIGKPALFEKEAEELLIEWGFKKEVEAVSYSKPILESGGYKMGYEWAKKNRNSYAIELAQEFLDKWDKGKLSTGDYDELYYHIDPASIADKMGFAEQARPTTIEEMEQFYEEHKEDKKVLFNDGSFDKGIVWGVMNFIKERRDFFRK